MSRQLLLGPMRDSARMGKTEAYVCVATGLGAIHDLRPYALDMMQHAH